MYNVMVGRYIDDKYITNIIEASPPGYIVDASNKFLHHKILPICDQRKLSFEGRKCCTKTIITCGIINAIVPKNMCYQCNGNQEQMKERFKIK